MLMQIIKQPLNAFTQHTFAFLEMQKARHMNYLVRLRIIVLSYETKTLSWIYKWFRNVLTSVCVD